MTKPLLGVILSLLVAVAALSGILYWQINKSAKWKGIAETAGQRVLDLEQYNREKDAEIERINRISASLVAENRDIDTSRRKWLKELQDERRKSVECDEYMSAHVGACMVKRLREQGIWPRLPKAEGRKEGAVVLYRNTPPPIFGPGTPTD